MIVTGTAVMTMRMMTRAIQVTMSIDPVINVSSVVVPSEMDHVRSAISH